MANLYDPKRVSLIVADNIVEGYAEDTFIETNFNEPERITFQMGAQGEVHANRNSNNTGYIKVFLKQSSLSNDLFSNLLQTSSIFSWLLRDETSVTTIAVSAASMIQMVPSIVRAKQQQEVEWQFFAIKYIYNMGGIPSLLK